MLADRRMLILLDNGRDPDQVRPLLPGGVGNRVLLTSRDHLSGLIAREGAARLTLGLLRPDEARSVLAWTLGPQRVAAEPEATTELARLCAFLPMALRIAAANLDGQPHQSVAEYAESIRPGRLDQLTVQGDTQSAVRAAIDQSYVALAESARRLFRRLGLVPCVDITAESASAIGEVSPAEAASTLGMLARAHLLEHRGPGRFGCHDLLCLYARERAEVEDDEAARRAVVTRLYDHYGHLAGRAAAVLHPHFVRLPAPPPVDEDDSGSGIGSRFDRSSFDTPGQASAWLDAERANLVAAITHAAVHGPRSAAWRLADAMRGHFMFRMDSVDWLTTATAGLAAACADGDRPGQAAAHLSLATLHSRLGDQQRAVDEYTLALARAEEAGWSDGAVAVHGSLGNVLLRMGQATAAAANYADVVTHARRTGQPALQAAAQSNLALAWMELGRPGPAADLCDGVLELCQLATAPNLEANALANLGQACHLLGRLGRARECFNRALAMHRELGDQDGEGWTLGGLAALCRDTGDRHEALRLGQDALRLTGSGNFGDRRHEVDALNTVGTILERLDRCGPASDHHRRAYELASRTGYRYAATSALLGQAAAQRGLGEPARALDTVRAALESATSGEFHVLEGQAWCLLAELHLDRDEADEAIAAGELAAVIQGETGYRLGEGQARVVLGRVRAGLGDPDSAVLDWRAALALFDDIGVADAELVRALIGQVGDRRG
jgi:tetratricopeptide (TPR) repeat protein